jgi:asparagine synthetase B (glutamine-hydrolysing)
VGYESGDSRHHEHPFAAIVANDLGTRHHEVICTNAFAVEGLPRLVWHMDEPTGDDLMAPYARVCQLARRDVKVVLSGEGSDEFMYGYRYYALEAVRRRARLVPGPLRWAARELIARWADPESFKGRALRCCLSDTSMESFLEWSAQLTSSERAELVGPRARLGTLDRRDVVRAALVPPAGDGAHLAAGMDGRYRMVDFILNRTDKLSMAASLECREPFLDHRLIEYLARVPVTRQIEVQAAAAAVRRGPAAPRDCLAAQEAVRRARGGVARSAPPALSRAEPARRARTPRGRGGPPARRPLAVGGRAVEQDLGADRARGVVPRLHGA